MARPSSIPAAAMAENLLKRKWSIKILRYIASGINEPARICGLESEISTSVLGERLRTMTRYAIIARFPDPSPAKGVEYRITARGKKVLTMLDILDQLDREP